MKRQWPESSVSLLKSGGFGIAYVQQRRNKVKTKKRTKKQLRAELATAEARICELEKPMSDRQLVVRAYSTSTPVWNILSATRGPDGGGKVQWRLKYLLTIPVRRWARGQSIAKEEPTLSYNQNAANYLLGSTGAAAQRMRHYLSHIYHAVLALRQLGLVPDTEMWYAEAILEATEGNFKPKVLVEALEKHQGKSTK